MIDRNPPGRRLQCEAPIGTALPLISRYATQQRLDRRSATATTTYPPFYG
ncbi:MAG: hypothetical protein AB2699_04380 [Candidatus Thiodiazotropha taylori]